MHDVFYSRDICCTEIRLQWKLSRRGPNLFTSSGSCVAFTKGLIAGGNYDDERVLRFPFNRPCTSNGVYLIRITEAIAAGTDSKMRSRISCDVHVMLLLLTCAKFPISSNLCQETHHLV